MPLIDKYATMDAIPAPTDADEAEYYDKICDAIETMPTIEAEPVRHAHWETWGFVFHGIEWKRCSDCGKCAGVSYYGLLDGKIEMETPARCGCCGAKMDAEEHKCVNERR